MPCYCIESQDIITADRAEATAVCNVDILSFQQQALVKDRTLILFKISDFLIQKLLKIRHGVQYKSRKRCFHFERSLNRKHNFAAC